jgi:hypothetical protein
MRQAIELLLLQTAEEQGQRMMVVWLVAASLLVSQVAAQCSPSPCGINTQCDVNPAGAAVCRCRATTEKSIFTGLHGSGAVSFRSVGNFSQKLFSRSIWS